MLRLGRMRSPLSCSRYRLRRLQVGCAVVFDPLKSFIVMVSLPFDQRSFTIHHGMP